MSNNKKELTIPIRVALLFILIGVIFKISLWQTLIADSIIFIGFTAISILYAMRFYRKEIKGAIAYIKMVLVLFWSLNGIFTILHLPYGEVFQIVSLVAFLFWAAMEGTSYFSKNGQQQKAQNYLLWNGIMIIGALAIVIGTLFSFFKWDYSIPLLVIGVFAVVLYILRDAFSTTTPEETEAHN